MPVSISGPPVARNLSDADKMQLKKVLESPYAQVVSSNDKGLYINIDENVISVDGLVINLQGKKLYKPDRDGNFIAQKIALNPVYIQLPALKPPRTPPLARAPFSDACS